VNLSAFGETLSMSITTDDEMRAQYERVLDRMVMAGWARSYTVQTGKGFSITWETAGGQKAIVLKLIVKKCSLLDDERNPVMLDRLARGQETPDVEVQGALDPTVAEFWVKCVDELELAGDEDGLNVFANLIHNAAPNEKTVLL
jgi:hypothetical protein